VSYSEKLKGICSKKSLDRDEVNKNMEIMVCQMEYLHTEKKQFWYILDERGIENFGIF
jgi:hypothetical protein